VDSPGYFASLPASKRSTVLAALEGASAVMLDEIDACPAEAELPDFCPSCAALAWQAWEITELTAQLKILAVAA